MAPNNGRARLQPRSPEPTLEELERGLKIDEHGLEQECVQQPELFYRIAKQAMRARTVRDQLKRDLERIEAEAVIEIRAQAERRDVKMTVKDIEAAVIMNLKVRQATSQLGTANETLGNLEALKESYSQRKDMLRELANLYVANYYSTPDISRRVRDAAGDQATEGLRRARLREREASNRRT
jgi:hypothetical protein